MKEKLLENNYIVNSATGMDWNLHRGRTEVLTAGKDKILNEMSKLIPEGTEYMIIKDTKTDKEYEYSIIVKSEDKYFFVTDAYPKTIKE